MVATGPTKPAPVRDDRLDGFGVVGCRVKRFNVGVGEIVRADAGGRDLLGNRFKPHDFAYLGGGGPTKRVDRNEVGSANTGVHKHVRKPGRGKQPNAGFVWTKFRPPG